MQHNPVLNLHIDHDTRWPLRKIFARADSIVWQQALCSLSFTGYKTAMLENKRRTGTEKAISVVSPLFVLSRCVSGSSVWRFCTTWMTRCKGPIALQEGSTSKARWTFTRVSSLCDFANGYSYFEFISTARRYLHCAILRYFVKKFAKGVAKEDANTTTPNTKRANTVIFHQHKLQHISFICDYS